MDEDDECFVDNGCQWGDGSCPEPAVTIMDDEPRCRDHAGVPVRFFAGGPVLGFVEGA